MNCKILVILFTILILSLNSFAQKNYFPYPETEDSFITFIDTCFLSAYLKINDKKSSDFVFYISGEKKKCFTLRDENFINVQSKNFFLLNFRLAFLTLKYNVIPYLHPDFVIKFLFLLNKVKYLPRVSDAMRTTEEQLRYKKRGWSNVEDSPHLLGFAADLSYYSRYDRGIIQKYCFPLGIRYIEHGGRGNNHIHLQDETLWLMKRNYSISEISDSLNKKLTESQNILKPYAENLYPKKYKEGIEIKFNTEYLDIIKIEFITPTGFCQAEITTGVFESGNHTLYLNTDFLRVGIYCVRVFKNGMYLYQKNFIKFEIKSFSP